MKRPRSCTRTEVHQQFAALGTEPVGDSPQAFGRCLDAEFRKWAVVVKQSGAKVD